MNLKWEKYEIRLFKIILDHDCLPSHPQIQDHLVSFSPPLYSYLLFLLLPPLFYLSLTTVLNVLTQCYRSINLIWSTFDTYEQYLYIQYCVCAFCTFRGPFARTGSHVETFRDKFWKEFCTVCSENYGNRLRTSCP